MITKKLWNSLDQGTRNIIGLTLNQRGEQYLQPYFHDFDFDRVGIVLKGILECCNLQKDGTIKVTRTVSPNYDNKPRVVNKVEKKTVEKQVTDSFMINYIKKKIQTKANANVIFLSTYINGLEDKEEDVADWYEHNKNKVLKIREVDDLICIEGRFDGDSYCIYKKPCKEFLSLQKYFNKLNTTFTLKKDSIYTDCVNGKRDDISVFFRTLLCHKPGDCERLLRWLRANKATSSRVLVNKVEDEDTPDRYNGDGEDMESEYQGELRYGIKIRILTPKGRVRNEEIFYVY